MIDNGFNSEWIQLSKEIIEETNELKRKLSEIRNNIGMLPLNPKDRLIWEDNMKKFKSLIMQINNKIDKYNLLVPILQKQMLHVNLNKFVEEALSILPVKNIKKSLDSNYENLNQMYRKIYLLLLAIFLVEKLLRKLKHMLKQCDIYNYNII